MRTKPVMFDMMQRGEDLPLFTGQVITPTGKPITPPAPDAWIQDDLPAEYLPRPITKTTAGEASAIPHYEI